MAEPSGRALVEQYARAIQDKDFDAQATLMADDFVDEMPQSGERTRGKANYLALVRNYPGGVGTVGGTLVGVLTIGVINNIMGLNNVDANLQLILKGAIILGAVWLQRKRR